jgi:hypothetical protein
MGANRLIPAKPAWYQPIEASYAKTRMENEQLAEEQRGLTALPPRLNPEIDELENDETSARRREQVRFARSCSWQHGVGCGTDCRRACRTRTKARGAQVL